MNDDIIQWGPTPARARACLGGVVLADSAAAVELVERAHAPVLYFPPGDVVHSLLTPTDFKTHCPYKGDARYWSVTVDGQTYENAVWCYDNPIPMAARIKGLMAFWAAKLGPDFEMDIEA